MSFTSKNPAFIKLQKMSYEQAVYNSISSVLEWDQETYMPIGAIEVRGRQIELLSGLIHKQKRQCCF